jgi:hypothetical protein
VEITASDTTAQFAFKSMGFPIKGQAEAKANEVVVDVDLPVAAMMFKDKAQKAIQKNITRALEAGT